MVCLGNICINTLQKGAKDDDDDNDDDNNNNNNNSIKLTHSYGMYRTGVKLNDQYGEF
jgi:hypothetical protein